MGRPLLPDDLRRDRSGPGGGGLRAVEEPWGPVEVLVANAGITRDTLVLRMSEEAWAEVIETNLTGVFRVTKRALTKMLRLHRGRIIMVSSVGAFIGSPGQANYAASKAGLVGHGPVDGPGGGQPLDHGERDRPWPGRNEYARSTRGGPTGRDRPRCPWAGSAQPEEMAEAVGFLASPVRGTSPAPSCQSTADWPWACDTEATDRQ